MIDEDRFSTEQLDTIKGIIERLREAADDLEDSLKSNDANELEGAVGEAQYFLTSAGKALKEMI